MTVTQATRSVLAVILWCSFLAACLGFAVGFLAGSVTGCAQ